MAISLEIINVGVENQATGSDDLYTAFNKTKNNFSRLSSLASQYTNFVGSTGITATSVGDTVTIKNTGVISLVAGTGLAISTTDGVSTLSISGYGNSTLVAGVTSIGLSSDTLDVSPSPIVSSGSLSVNLPTTGIVAGDYIAPAVTVDEYGRITAIESTVSTGTVTSVAIEAVGDGISVSDSPITSSGTIHIQNTGVTKLNAGQNIQLSGRSGEVTISSVIVGGTVNTVGVTSTTLVVSGSPIIDAGVITIELPDDITLIGNITTANADLGNAATANYFIGDGSLLINLPTVHDANYANFAGTVITNAQPNITSVGTLVSTTLAANANITLSGSLSQVSGGNLLSATYITGTLTTAAQPNITSVGTLASITHAANANITLSGSLSRITGVNSVSATYLTGTLTTAAQPNITSVGTLSSLSVSGNVSAGNVSVTGLTTSYDMSVQDLLNVYGGIALFDSSIPSPKPTYLQANPSISGGYTVFTLPNNTGSQGQVLTLADGTGNTQWSQPVSSSAPSTASSTGVAGQIAYDSSYVYVCIATNTWKRASIASW